MGAKRASKALPNKMPKTHSRSPPRRRRALAFGGRWPWRRAKAKQGPPRKPAGDNAPDFPWVCPVTAISAEVSSSFRGPPNRKLTTNARRSLRRGRCSVGAGSVPRIGKAFGLGAGSRGLAGLQAVKGAAAAASSAVRCTRIISVPSWAAGIDAAAPLPPAVPLPRQPWGSTKQIVLVSLSRLHPVVSGQRLFALESFAMQIRYPVEGSATIYSTRHYQQPGKTARLASDKALVGDIAHSI